MLGAAILVAAALYLGAALLTGWPSIAATFAGVLLGCWTTLALLNDYAIAGSAAWGFWLPVLANWIAAWAGVASLADIETADKTLSRAVNLAIPLLFGAFLFYLWEVTVRGFGVPSVLFPAPSAIAVRFAASLRMLWEDFFQTFILGVVSGYIIGCSAGFLTAVVAHRYTFLGRGLLADRQFCFGFADCRHRADHGDVVRLRLAVEGRGRRRHHILSDAGEHARRPQCRGPY